MLCPHVNALKHFPATVTRHLRSPLEPHLSVCLPDGENTRSCPEQGMTWAGTWGEDRGRAGVANEVATVPIGIALRVSGAGPRCERGWAATGAGLGRDRWMPVVMVFIRDRVIMTER